MSSAVSPTMTISVVGTRSDREGEDQSWRRIDTEAGIVSGDECQEVLEAELAHMSTRGRLGHHR